MNIKNEKIPALLLKMKALRSTLSNSEKKVVDYIIENPEEVIHLSVAGLADNSDVSDATVVRTCRKIGMTGYQDLKLTLAKDIVKPLQNIHEEISENDDAQTILDKVFQSTLHALNFTHDTINVKYVEKAAKAIMKARRVCILGLGNSHSIAIDLQHKLMRLSVDAVAFTDSHMQVIAATSLKKEDVLFAISLSGSSRDIVDAARIAKAKGATIISLTNIGSSPLSREADIQLYTASKETRYRIVGLSSRIAQSAIIDAIYTMIAVQKEGSVETFRDIERNLQSKKY